MLHTRRSVLSALGATAAGAAVRLPLSQAQSPGPSASSSNTSPHDPLRPAFHYLPARNWMNDPCAPVFFRGQYHMFHQYNPHAAVWGDMHWAHAVSPDMVHWKRLPVALAPTPNSPGGVPSPDSAGCFTGSAVFQHGAPAIIYTGVEAVPHEQATLSDGSHNFRETQLLATSSEPSLGAWRKHPQPVIPSPPSGMKVTGFRDPTPFEHAGILYLVVGSGIAGKGGMVLLYRAAKLPGGAHDLTHWEYLHPLAEGQLSSKSGSDKDPVDKGEMWECPDFFALGHRHVLIYSTERKTFWQVGDLDPATLRFHPTASGLLDDGCSFYAPKTQLDAHGNRILWGWLSEKRTDAEMTAAGWSGMLSLPRVLTIEDGELRMRPLPALHQLRTSAPGKQINEFNATLQQTHDGNVAPPFVLSDSHGPLFGIQNGASTGFHTEGVPVGLIRPPIELGEHASIHIFFDSSVIEIFLDGRFCHTHRFYARDPRTPILTLWLPSSRVLDPRSYTLKPIWPA